MKWLLYDGDHGLVISFYGHSATIDEVMKLSARKHTARSSFSICAYLASALERALEAKATGASFWRQAAPSPLLDASADNTTGFPASKNFSTGGFVRSSFSLSNAC